MRRRRGFNPKRKLAQNDRLTREGREELANQVGYGGNPEHKKSPGDYGLSPPSAPRANKTLCDATKPLLKQEAIDLLKSGITKGMVSEQFQGKFPQNVWSVDSSGEAYEAQLENKQLGVYHGYPMPASDPFRATILKEWALR